MRMAELMYLQNYRSNSSWDLMFDICKMFLYKRKQEIWSSGSAEDAGWQIFVCVEVLRPSQPKGVMSSAVSLPNHTFTGQIDNCPSWISGRKRMTVENISWSISMKECCRPRLGLNRRPPGLQSDGTSKWATKAGTDVTQQNLKCCLLNFFPSMQKC